MAPSLVANGHAGHRLACLPALLVACAVAGCGDGGPSEPGGDGGPNAGPELALVPVVTGLQRPVHVAAPAGDSRLFIVEKAGRILVMEAGSLLPTPFLDLRGAVSTSGEQGLLSLAFHPNHAANGRLFVDYTDADGNTRIVRYTVGADPNVADAASAVTLLSIEQPFSNHNGGHLRFGPGGRLFVSVGDGGGAGDPGDNGQDPTTLLGSVLRLDVDGADPYEIPVDNPFAGDATRRPEIWLWGVRNPWRIAFDEATAELYVADVGQSEREEITVVGPEAGGANLGWNVMEGSRCFSDPGCSPQDFTLPQVEYYHDEGCSITGGDVYRGSVTELRGVYFYSDYCRGWLRSFRFVDGSVTERTEWDIEPVGNVTSFGTDGRGELHLLTEDAVYRIERAPQP